MSVYVADADFTLHLGDVRDVLPTLPADSVDCVATSPPFYGLRDYGTGSWAGGDPGCDHKHETRHQVRGATSQRQGRSNEEEQRNENFRDVCGKCGAQRTDRQIGLEATPDQWAQELVRVFRECRRILKPTGVMFVEVGDSYANDAKWGGASGNKNYTSAAGGMSREKRHTGLKAKDLIGAPWLLAFALRADGWYLRQCLIWNKPNCMPESAKDRCTTAHSYVFLFSKKPRYWFDSDAIAEPAAWERWGDQTTPKHTGTDTSSGWMGPRTKAELTPRQDGDRWNQHNGRGFTPAGPNKNARSVWTIPTQGYPEAHFACVDDQTEALTPHGWKKHADLRDGDTIAMYDPDADECRFSPADFHRYDYSGELVAIEKRDSSQRLTPNHRCYVRRRSGWTGIVRADELKPGMEILTCAPLRIDEAAGVGLDHAALIGWYVTEGTRNYAGRVTIYQSDRANPTKVAAIRGHLAAVGADVRESRRTREDGDIEVSFAVRGETGRFLDAAGKRLDLDSIRLPRDEAEVLLAALISGDGHRRPDGRSVIVQKDKVSIDRMQMLALRLGYRAVVSERKSGVSALFLTRGRWLTLRATDGRHEPIGREHYDGTVWCPSVATGLWLARRNGRTFITGNTWPEALAERIVKAGCPEWACGVCGKPRERIVDKQPRIHKGDSGRNNVQGMAQRGKREDGKAIGTVMRERFQAGYDVSESWSDCGHNAYRPGTILDPFMGAGTTALVARRLGRHSVGVELNEEYAAMCARRLGQQSLLAGEHEPVAPRVRQGLTGGAYSPPGQTPHGNARKKP